MNQDKNITNKFEPNRTDWSTGKAIFDATGGRVAYQDASYFVRKTIGIKKEFFF